VQIKFSVACHCLECTRGSIPELGVSTEMSDGNLLTASEKGMSVHANSGCDSVSTGFAAATALVLSERGTCKENTSEFMSNMRKTKGIDKNRIIAVSEGSCGVKDAMGC
jgi:hypothetical protein